MEANEQQKEKLSTILTTLRGLEQIHCFRKPPDEKAVKKAYKAKLDGFYPEEAVERTLATMKSIDKTEVDEAIEEIKPILDLFPRLKEEILNWKDSAPPFPNNDLDFEDDGLKVRRILKLRAMKDFFLENIHESQKV